MMENYLKRVSFLWNYVGSGGELNRRTAKVGNCRNLLYQEKMSEGIPYLKIEKDSSLHGKKRFMS